jgi:hypothetical protein
MQRKEHGLCRQEMAAIPKIVVPTSQELQLGTFGTIENISLCPLCPLWLFLVSYGLIHFVIQSKFRCITVFSWTGG